MAHISWTRDLETGIDVIDSQHKKIVLYINQLDSVKDTNDQVKIHQVLDELVEYTVSHFAYEEALMEEASYPFIAPHKKVHGLFVKRVDDYCKRFKEGEDVTSELLLLLKNWLINHIKSEDADYVDVVKSMQDELHHKVKGGLLSRFFKSLF